MERQLLHHRADDRAASESSRTSSGAEASGQGKNDYQEWNAWIAFLEKNRVSCLNCSVSDKAGETISVLRPGARAAGGWRDSELAESGQQVRALLRS